MTEPTESFHVEPPAAGQTGLAPPTIGSSPVPDRRHEVRMRTVVLGLVLLVIAGAVLLDQLTGIVLDPAAIVLALMVGGGLMLIAGTRRS